MRGCPKIFPKSVPTTDSSLLTAMCGGVSKGQQSPSYVHGAVYMFRPLDALPLGTHNFQAWHILARVPAAAVSDSPIGNLA